MSKPTERILGALGAVRVAEFQSAGAHASPRHAHESAMVSLLLSGSYRERCNSVALDHHPFLLAYHPPGFEHEDTFGSGGGTMLVIEIAAPGLDSELTPSVPQQVESAAAVTAAWRLRDEITRMQSTCALTVEGLLLDLLTETTREWRSYEIGRPRWLRNVTERLRDEYRQPIPLAQLAADAGVHLGHLWRVFRRMEGCSPSEYVQRLRCLHVLRRLGEGGVETRLADLALEAGFSDQSHLTRVFRRVMHASPGAVQRTLRQ